MEKEALVYVDLDGRPHLVGRLWARVRKDKGSATFEYDQGWLEQRERFSLEPALKLGPGLDVWEDASDAAGEFWGRGSEDSRLSEHARLFCASNAKLFPQ